MDQLIAAYPTLAVSLIIGLFGICMALVGTVWRLVNSTLKGLKDSIKALNETLGEAFGEMRSFNTRLSRLEGEHGVNHHLRVGGTD